jgi:hypothetical protein
MARKYENGDDQRVHATNSTAASMKAHVLLRRQCASKAKRSSDYGPLRLERSQRKITLNQRDLGIRHLLRRRD